MQAKLVDSMRPEDRIYEIKFDRCRALALLGGSETWILSPNQRSGQQIHSIRLEIPSAKNHGDKDGSHRERLRRTIIIAKLE